MCAQCDTMAPSDYPVLNVRLLKDLLTWAKADRDSIEGLAAKFGGWGNWDQTAWGKEIVNGVCRSAYCMAGQAVVQAGYGLLYQRDGEEYDEATGKYLPCRVAYDCAPMIAIGTDERGNVKQQPVVEHAEPIREVGRRVLGLTNDEAESFFDGDNDLDELFQYADQFASVRGLDPIVDVDNLKVL